MKIEQRNVLHSHQGSEPSSLRSGRPATPPPFAHVSNMMGLERCAQVYCGHPLVNKGLATHPTFGEHLGELSGQGQPAKPALMGCELSDSGVQSGHLPLGVYWSTKHQPLDTQQAQATEQFISPRPRQTPTDFSPQYLP